MQMNQRAAHYWNTFIQEQAFPEGLAFDKALRQAKLDFSLKSLDRIDQLLDQIRTKLKPEIGVFLARPDCQDFVFLLGFYLGMLTAKHSQAPINWLDYEGLAGLYPGAAEEYPRCFASTVSCMLGRSSLLFPLSPILERLFEPEDGRTVRSMTERYITPPIANLNFRQPAADAPLAAHLQPLAVTMHIAGYLTAHKVWDLSQSSAIMPATCTHFADGKKIVKSMMLDSLEASLEAGRDELSKNPEHGIGMALIYDATIKLAEGPCDALVLELRNYAPTPLAMILAVPYRAAKHPKGFAVHQVKLMESSAVQADLDALFEQFFIGVQQHSSAAPIWQAALDESV